jgi:hypothetical protein
MERITGLLTLTNPSTSEIHEYKLHGKGLEPYQEDTLVIPCKARETMTYSIEVRNDKPKPVTYHID